MEMRESFLFPSFFSTRLKKPIAEALWHDYQRGGGHDKPSFLAKHFPAAVDRSHSKDYRTGPKRQARHAAA
jgi:hypothetical protein